MVEELNLNKTYDDEGGNALRGALNLLLSIGAKLNEVVGELNKRDAEGTINIDRVSYRPTNQFRFQRRMQTWNYGKGTFTAPVQQQDMFVDVLQQLYLGVKGGEQEVWIDVPLTEVNYYLQGETFYYPQGEVRITMLKKYQTILIIIGSLIVIVSASFGATTYFAKSSELQELTMETSYKFLEIRAKDLQDRMWAYEDRYGEDKRNWPRNAIQKWKEWKSEYDTIIKKLEIIFAQQKKG